MNTIVSEMRSIFGMSRSAGSSAAASPGSGYAASDSSATAVWLSIDPRTGDLSLYPPAAVFALERAYSGRHPRQVHLSGLGLGPLYEQLSVDLGSNGDAEGATQKRAGGGKRDVKRVEVAADAPREVRVHVFRDRGWRISSEPVPGVTEERCVSLTVMAAPSSPASASSSHAPRAPRGEFLVGFRHPTVEDLQERAAEVAKEDAAGLVGLWEWCRLAEVDSTQRISPEMWAVYSAEQDEMIEKAFRAGETKVSIAVGIRTYDIMFEGARAAGKQVDTRHKKRRFVRRRAVQRDEHSAALQAAESALQAAVAEDPTLADAECVICSDSFADTPAMPVVRLPKCGHRFHGACVQDLADRRKTCPCCRAQVNWREVRALLDVPAQAPPPPARSVSYRVQI